MLGSRTNNPRGGTLRRHAAEPDALAERNAGNEDVVAAALLKYVELDFSLKATRLIVAHEIVDALRLRRAAYMRHYRRSRRPNQREKMT